MQRDRMNKRCARLLILSAIFFAASARADVLIGVGVPLTGAQASIGQQILKGVQFAVEDLNAAGGLNGEKIVVT